jgi:hypothetical protein
LREDGKKVYDGSWAVVLLDTEDGETVQYPAIPLTNYANYFINKNNYKEISVCIYDNLENILEHWAGFATVSKFDCEVELIASADDEDAAEVKISHLGMSSTYFIINVDGKNYQAYYTVNEVTKNFYYYDEELEEVVSIPYKANRISLYFLSNVSQTLGRKLYDAGLVDGYWVWNCLSEEYVSSVTDPDTGATYNYVSYALEDEVARRAATSTNE